LTVAAVGVISFIGCAGEIQSPPTTTEDTYTLSVTVVPDGSGSISLDPAGGNYEAGTGVTLTATPAEGYAFSHWGGPDTRTSNLFHFTMDSSKEVFAYFYRPATPTPTPATLPETAPELTPAPGIGVPVVGDSWQVMVENAREETRLAARGSEYTPKSGYTFLVVDVEFLNLGPSKMFVLSDEVAVITVEGETISAAGGAYQGEDPALGYLDMFAASPEDPLSLCFAFIVKAETIDQAFKLQFQEVPLIPCSVGKQM